jgi:hypothetical protein
MPFKELERVASRFPLMNSLTVQLELFVYTHATQMRHDPPAATEAVLVADQNPPTAFGHNTLNVPAAVNCIPRGVVLSMESAPNAIASVNPGNEIGLK